MLWGLVLRDPSETALLRISALNATLIAFARVLLSVCI